MNFQSFPKIERIRFGKFAALTTGFGWNDWQFIFGTRQNIPVTFLQIDERFIAQTFFSTLGGLFAGFLQQAFHIARPGVVMCVDDRSQFTQQM